MSLISPHWVELGCSIGSLILLLIAAVSLHKINFAQIRVAGGAKHVQDAQKLSKLLSIIAAILVLCIAYMYYISMKQVMIGESTMSNLLTAIRISNIAAFFIVCMISYNLSKIPAQAFMGASKKHYNNASKSITGYIVVMVLCYMFKMGKEACTSPESRTYIGGDYY